MPLEISFISNFLSTVEGKRQTVGYIPCHIIAGGTANYKGIGDPAAFKAMGASGVTVATGCDLGQTTADILHSYGLDGGVIHPLIPYIGKKQDSALRILHRLPLTISTDTAEAIDIAVHGGYIRRYVIPAFERECHKMRFADLPKQAQAAISSICFQKGVGGTRRGAPKTWDAMIRCDWDSAADELIHGFTKYSSRRKAEGLLLREVA